MQTVLFMRHGFRARYAAAMQRFSCALVALSWLSGCSMLPDELKLPEEQVVVGFSQVIQAPKEHVGQMVRWGGVIAKVTNLADHSLIEIANYPLQNSGRPNVDSENSQGRFRAQIEGLADPIVYKEGKSITLVGRLGQPISSKIGEFNYTFPLVLTQQLVLWQELSSEDNWHYRNHGWPYHDYYYGHPYYRNLPYRDRYRPRAPSKPVKKSSS